MIKNLLILMCFVLSSLAALAQKTVTGKVSDETGSPLPGVSVLLKGTTIGTVSDADGNFSISIQQSDAGNATLVFSFIGFIQQEVPVGSQSSINVTMEPDIQTLNEVVVVGYGTMRREDISGAVTSISTKELPQVANTSINHLLQGRAPGLNISQRSAQPGGGMNINIRGAISQQGNNSPLYVIDGVPLFNNDQPEQGLSSGQLGFGGGVDRNPLNTINPSDIESIDILKDASATAIYGASAANGVVLITTKRGKEGPLNVDYRGSYTVQTPGDYVEVLGSKEFMQQHNRLAHDQYLFNNELAPYGSADPSSVAPFNPRFTTYDIQTMGGQGTDWLDLLMRNGEIHEHNVSISGGNKNTKIYTAFNLFDNKGVLENSDFRRYTGRLNVDQRLGSRVNLGINLTASQINSTNSSTGSNSGGSEKYNMLQAAYSFAPNLGIYEEDGTFTRSYSPLITNPAAFLIMDDELTTSRLFVAPKVEIEILSSLKLSLVGGLDQQNSQRGFYLPRAAENPQFPNGSAQKSNGNIGNYSSEAYLTFNKSFEGLTVNVVAGGGLYRTTSSGFNVEAVNFFTDTFEDDNLGAAIDKNLSNFGSWRSERDRQSLFSRVNLSYKDKYILALTGRIDGDTQFAEKAKVGFFPGVSAAWRISEESFMEGVGLISDLKLRAGIGQAGNPINSGSWLALLRPAYKFPIGGNVYPGVAQSQLRNPDLTWETNETINLGLDIEILGGRVSATAEVYQRTAKDLLDWDVLPLSNEITRKRANIGSTRSQGVEFTLNTVNIKAPFTWTTTLTGNTYKSFWVERNLATPLPEWVKEGDPLTAIYGWETDGIIQSVEEIPAHMPNANPGNIQFVDQNNDNVLNGQDVVLLGQWDPAWNIGLANTFRYKNFDLNFFFNAFLGNMASTNSIGRGYDPNSPGGRLALANMENVPIEVREVWTADNPDGTLPGMANNPYGGNNPSGRHDFTLQRADFARLRNVTLGYALSNTLLNKTFIRSVRVFVDVQNLATFTEFEGFDPEFSETNPYPQAISTTVGVNVGF